MKKQVVFLRGRKTTLRPMTVDDAPTLQRWVNDPEIRTFIERTLPISIMEEVEWINGGSKSSKAGIHLVIEVKGVPIGVMGIDKIDWVSRIGTTGAIIGEKRYWNKGYGTDAKMALLKYAFDTLGLRKMMSAVKAFNVRSLKYSLHCGYKIEGRLRNQFFVDGKYHDEIILGLFREDWLPYWKKYMKV